MECFSPEYYWHKLLLLFDYVTMHLKTRPKSEPNVLSMLRASTLFGAMEFVYSAETAYSTPLLESTGLSEQFTALTWSISPVIGCLLQPLIGIISDRCMCSWGRRKPFILILASALVFASVTLPSSRDLGLVIGNKLNLSPSSIAAGITIASVIMLDLCNDSIHTPLRAFLNDAFPKHLHDLGNTMYATVGGFGGTLGYMVCASDMSFIEKPMEKISGSSERAQEKAVFSVCVIVLICGALITLTAAKEKNPNIKRVEREREPLMKGCEDDEVLDHDDRVNAKDLAKSVFKMPYKLLVLIIQQFITCCVLFCYFLYFTNYVAKVVFKSEPGSKKYTAGVKWGCWGMAIMQITCFTFSSALPVLIKRSSIKFIYFASHLLGGAGFACMPFVANKYTVLVFSVFPGMLNAIHLTLPFIILSKLHENEFKHRGFGTDIALLVSTTFLSQIAVNLFLGAVMPSLGIHTIMYTASCMAVLGAIWSSIFLPSFHSTDIEQHFKVVSSHSLGSCSSIKSMLMSSSQTLLEDSTREIEDKPRRRNRTVSFKE